MTKVLNIKTLFVLLCSLSCIAVKAQMVLANFDNIPVGTRWTMWGVYGSGSSTATVEADPTNSQNHVLHIRLKDWNTFPEFSVPAEIAGSAVLKQYNSVRFRLYRTSSDNDGNKQVHIYYGTNQIYADQSYPYQGDQNVWQNRSYSLANIPESSTANKIRLGIHHSNSDYYIDDVALYGPFDDFKTVEGGVLNICTKNTSSSYAVYSTPTMIPEGESLSVYTSRYTDLKPELAGKGTLNIYGGGERTYLGDHSSKAYPSWNLFTGDVHIYPYKEVEKSAGFYGVVMAHNGKTFSPESVEKCLEEGKVCTMMGDNRVFLHSGAAIASESGSRASRFGELNTEEGSRIYGYYKNSSGANAYYLVGHLDTDATLAGVIATMDNTSSQNLGIIKEGKGTYSLTSTGNLMPGGIRVIGGRFNVDGVSKSPAYIFDNAVLGGKGTVDGTVENYAVVEPGSKSADGSIDVATLTVVSLKMHPASIVRIKVKSATEYDVLNVRNAVDFSTQTQDFVTASESPVLRVVLESDCNLSVGDELQVLTAASKASASSWNWDVIFPSRYTWSMEERTLSDGRYALVVKVTALSDDPGNKDNDDDDGDDDNGDDDNDTTTYGNDGDTKTLRQYADNAGVRLGVAVSSNVNINNAYDSRTRMIKEQFNMVVPENCLKFETVEPSQNYFNYSGGDNLANFAKNNNMYMRGHTLAWHSQIAQWVSSDGKKNDKGWTKKQLLDILKNHILNVVGHYKGKIGEWDVVNECLDDDQSILRSNPDGYKLRAQSVWTTVCGEEFIDSAFVWAHRADPDAKLYLNEYDNEFMGNAKSQAFYNLVKRLLKDGRPIHGVGFQCHLNAGNVDHGALRKNLQRYAELGLECAITELDLGVEDLKEASLQQQARDYNKIVSTAMSMEHCRSVMIWGLTDDESWRGSKPLLWDGANTAKPAFYAVRSGMRDVATGIDDAISEDGNGNSGASVMQCQWYSLSGMRLVKPEGVCIERILYSNGAVKSHVKVVK